MTPKHIYFGIALFAVILFGNSYFQSVRDTSKAEQVRADVKLQIDGIHSELKDEIAAIHKERDTVKTPTQVAQAIPKYQQGVNPIVIVPGGVPTNLSTVGGNIPSVSLPDAPSAIQGGLIIPRDEVPNYWKSVTQCAEDKLNLDACNKTVPLLTQRAEAAEKAMKGGGFFTRVKRNAKWTGIGIAIGAAGGYLATR